jgi:ribulose-phosphate 3-epimerase
LVCEALRKRGVQALIDVHLMVQPVDELARAFAAAGASWISFHPEATRHVDRTIRLIRDLGCRPGLVLNPATSLDCLDFTLQGLDHVLVMSVNPGFGGQSFIPGTLPKLREVSGLIAAGGRAVRLQVDGGINPDNIRAVAEAGADVFVAGSAIFGSADYAGTIRKMRVELAAADATLAAAS